MTAPPTLSTPKPASSPYATGGGGTVFEHRFAATVLAALLVGDPIPGLGDEFTVERVAFQASTESAVDDLVVTGAMSRNGAVEHRTLAIGVRHDPTIGPSDAKFVKLLRDCLVTLERHAAAFDKGAYRLAIVVAAHHVGAAEASQLADLARKFATSADFYNAVTSPGKFAEKLRTRLTLLEEATAAAQTGQAGLAALATKDLSWRLLRSLWMHQCRLESEDTDRTHCVQRLNSLVASTTDADELFEKLCKIAADCAVAGGVVDQSVLRRQLAGRVRISRSRSFDRAWRVLDGLGESLRARTPKTLRPRTGAGHEVRIERSDARETLKKSVRDAASRGGVLIVEGEPGVGKSALSIEVCDALASEGVSAVLLSLRDVKMDSVIQFEDVLGGRLSTVFGAAEVWTARLLLLDGAEIVQEGFENFVGELTRAACEAGFAVIAVTRQDALDNVESILRDALLSLNRIGVKDRVPTHTVDGFTDVEIDELVAAAPPLRRISQERRSRWLLRRPGLLKLLLESQAMASLPDGPLCEAVVYEVVWEHLVRNGERTGVGGATPDGREQVTYRLARSLLLPGQPPGAPYPDAQALPSLRRDGVLLRVGISGRKSDQFASDLLRDIAVWQVLLRESPRVLLEAGVPRWALHAARVTFQTLLLDGPAADAEWGLPAQIAFCESLGKAGTDRWADLPWEAALTITDPGALLGPLWNWLHSGGGKLFGELMRVLEIRFGGLALSDPLVGDAVVSLLCDHQPELAEMRDDVADRADDIILQWLRGMAAVKDASYELRIKVRETVVYRPSSRYRWNAYARHLECVGLLGADLDDVAVERLRTAARKRPDGLEDCLESLFASRSLATHRPELLLELAETYYIEPPDPSREVLGSHHTGVRDHSPRMKLGPMVHAAWLYGPFHFLLHSRVRVEAIAFINRLLNRAAQVRVRILGGQQERFFSDLAGVESGIDVDLPGLGKRHLVGDSHVWRWYRGASVGSYPCKSALMALDVAVDRWISQGTSISVVVDALLLHAGSLAMAGLVYGMLVRHIESAGAALDPWLAVPEVWRLEGLRVGEEQQGAAMVFAVPGNVLHAERRQWGPPDVAGCLVMTAMAANDHESIARLTRVSERLVENASQRWAPPEPDAEPANPDKSPPLNEDVLVFRRYAGMLVAANYPTVQHDGFTTLEYVPPRDVEDGLAQLRNDAERGRQVYELQARYGIESRQTSVAPDQVRRDLAFTLSLLDDPPQSGAQFLQDAVAAVAMVAVQMHARGDLTLSGEEFALALAVLILSVRDHPHLDSAEDGSLYSIGADRSAAKALPATLPSSFAWPDMAPEESEELERRLPEAFSAIVNSPVIEVQVAFADGLRGVWIAPCGELEAGRCFHVEALDLVIETTRRCHLGPRDETHRRGIDPLPLPLDESLPAAAAGSLLKWRLATAIGALGDCARSACCVADRAHALLVPVTRAYGATVAEDEHLEQPAVEEARFLVAASLLPLSAQHGTALLLELLGSVLKSPIVAARLLDDLCLAATYSAQARAVLQSLWPVVMERCIATWPGNIQASVTDMSAAGLDRLLASLLPMPRGYVRDKAARTRIEEAGRTWVEPAAIARVMDQWLPLALGVPTCVDAIAGFLEHRSVGDRVQFGLPWLERTIGSGYDLIARRTSRLVRWIGDTLRTGQVAEDAVRGFHRIVDGLAARGDLEALRFQQSIEGGNG
jgi:hypothetical protein